MNIVINVVSQWYYVYLFAWLFWAALGLAIFQLQISIHIYPLVRTELWVENDLVLVTITCDRAANLDLCLALTAFISGVILHATPTATRDP
jgi:hypothetical protein